MIMASVLSLQTPSTPALHSHAAQLLQQQQFEQAFIAAKRALDTAMLTVPDGRPTGRHLEQQLICARCWLTLAQAAAGMGDLEVAYCLYAKGLEHCLATGQQLPGPERLFAKPAQQQQQQQQPNQLALHINQLQVTNIASWESDEHSGRAHLTGAGDLRGQPQQLARQRSRLQLQQQAGHQQAAAKAAHNVHHSLPDLLLQLAAGRLDVLAAMTQSPKQHQHQHHQQPPKRWLHMQQRFQTSLRNAEPAECNGSSSSDSSNSTGISSSSSKCRVFCVSDLHVDKSGGRNLAWVKHISTSVFQADTLIVAGDIADTAVAVQATFKLLVDRFKRVIWVPGNHEAWLRPGTSDNSSYPDSLAKVFALRQMADAIGVDVGPIEVAPGLIVLPLLSWYNAEFDTAHPRPGHYRHDSFCSWPVPEEQVWQVMMRLNAPAIAMVQSRIQQLQQQQKAWCSLQRLPERRLSQYVKCVPTTARQRYPKLQTAQQGQRPEAVTSEQASPTAPQPGSSGILIQQPGKNAANIAGLLQQDQQSQPQQRLPASSVVWNRAGVLAVSSARQVPGLQLNLTPLARLQHSTAQQPILNNHHHQLQKQLLTQQQQQNSQLVVITQPHQQVHLQQLQQLPEGQQLQGRDNMGQSNQPANNAINPADNSPNGSISAGRYTACTTAAAAVLDHSQQQATPSGSPGGSSSGGITVITVSHFLPHTALPHSRISELSKAMGCCQLQHQLQQVAAQLHVYGHSHINTDIMLSDTPKLPDELVAAAAQANLTSTLRPGPDNCMVDAAAHSGTLTSGVAQLQEPNKMIPSSSSSSSENSSWDGSNSSCMQAGTVATPGERRYVQYALDAISCTGCMPGLYCLWDGCQLAPPDTVVPING